MRHSFVRLVIPRLFATARAIPPRDPSTGAILQPALETKSVIVQL
jgi:hypothetical protein